ncbi:hypothetical protein GCK32_012998 [Trichostrongylus colubriformis]|uniref:Uncharacterized protein n=1 Tax=Trichostrongylus colubriformis TaxID=6319 RepID=A0AAN8ILY6_TRICO
MNHPFKVSYAKLFQSVKIPTLDVIEILGYDFYPIFSSFTLNGVKVNIDTQASSYMSLSRRLFISTKNLINLSKADAFELSWSHQPVGDDSS